MHVACIQPEILSSRKACYNEVDLLLKKLIEDQPTIDIISLPERWLPFSNKMKENIQEERGESYNFIKELAKTYKVSILSGAIWENRISSEKPWITCYYFDEYGNELGRQDKIHLYSFERKNFQNSDILHVFKFRNYRFSILICFDMAFFETPRLAALNGAEILFSPTQIREEGMENWNIYLKARALENRIPIVATNSFGSIFKRRFIGESKIITFTNGFISPSQLEIYKADINQSSFISRKIDLKFPNKLRDLRLNERVNMNDVKIKTH